MSKPFSLSLVENLVIKKKFFIEYWGETDGIFRTEVKFTYDLNAMHFTPLEVSFTATEDVVLCLIQIVDEENIPILMVTPQEIQPNLCHPFPIKAGDSLNFYYAPSFTLD